MSYYFAMVNARDIPLYEANLGNPFKDDGRHIHQFILHASLDVVDQVMWTSPNMYLRTIDKFNDWLVSAFVTSGNIRFLLLHSTSGAKNEDGIKNFFTDVHELFVKILLNPFYEIDQVITNPQFDFKVRTLSKRYL